MKLGGSSLLLYMYTEVTIDIFSHFVKSERTIRIRLQRGCVSSFSITEWNGGGVKGKRVKLQKGGIKVNLLLFPARETHRFTLISIRNH